MHTTWDNTDNKCLATKLQKQLPLQDGQLLARAPAVERVQQRGPLLASHLAEGRQKQKQFPLQDGSLLAMAPLLNSMFNRGGGGGGTASNETTLDRAGKSSSLSKMASCWQ